MQRADADRKSRGPTHGRVESKGSAKGKSHDTPDQHRVGDGPPVRPHDPAGILLPAPLAAGRPCDLGQPDDPALRVERLRWPPPAAVAHRSEEHTSELQSLMRISYAVFCLKKKK